ncbi:hypothetical protein D3C73_1401340 [compost metagenome]
MFIAAVLEYLKIRAQQKAIADKFSFSENPDKTSENDYAYFKLGAKPLDAIEIFYTDWEVE